MAGWLWADAVSNVPRYTGQALRILSSALMSKPTNRPLGGITGVSPGTTDAVLAVTPSMAIVQPITGVLDLSAAGDGATPFGFDAAVTKPITAADSSNPRVDLLYVRHDDPAETSDGSSPAAVIGYRAGNAAASPVLPAAQAREMPLARIDMPKLNNGNPTISLIAPFTVAAGGILPVRDATNAPPPNPYVGMAIYDLATKQTLQWNGTKFVAPGGDTGWQPITNVNAGYTVNRAEWRVKNGELRVLLDFVRPGNSVLVNEFIAQLPAGAFPTRHDRYRIPFMSNTSNAAGGHLALDNAGRITVGQVAGSTTGVLSEPLPIPMD